MMLHLCCLLNLCVVYVCMFFSHLYLFLCMMQIIIPCFLYERYGRILSTKSKKFSRHYRDKWINILYIVCIPCYTWSFIIIYSTEWSIVAFFTGSFGRLYLSLYLAKNISGEKNGTFWNKCVFKQIHYPLLRYWYLEMWLSNTPFS